MSLSSAGTILCQPTELYNMLTKEEKEPAILDPMYLVLLDVREGSKYNAAHVTLARSAKTWSSGDDKELHLPYNLHLPTTCHCVIYDSNTVSNIETTPAVELANKLAMKGSKNPVMILKGGYERFSAEYPFLRTEKIIYSPRELHCLPRYPSEVLPLFLYLGDKRHANNAAMNYNLKIRTHFSLDQEVKSAFPGKVRTFHLEIDQSDDQSMLSHFPEICNYLETCRKMNERVLVYEETGCSRSATAVLAYLIKNKMKLKEALDHVRKCRHHVLPLQTFLDQLTYWESQVKTIP